VNETALTTISTQTTRDELCIAMRVHHRMPPRQSVYRNVSALTSPLRTLQADASGARAPLGGGSMNRRSFLKGAAVTATAAVPFTAFIHRAAAAQDHKGGLRRGQTAGYGPLFPTMDQTTGLPLLLLPEGFKYLSFGWTRDPLSTGQLTPGAHDGMAAFPAGRGRVRLVRNHEVGNGTPFSSTVYNTTAGGGTTTLEFDTQQGELISATDSLSGTIRNCAGGPTPWGTWLTCEETTQYSGLPHGYIFEVPADGLGDPTPLRDMGRFSHEAVAVDPATGYVYETEDAGGSSGFYRFVPTTPGALGEGGELLMLKVVGVDSANLGASYANGATFDVEWVPIATPDNAAPGMPGNFVWAQGRALGAATFARLEGCWYGNDAKIYVVSTSGGIGQGQIWEYDPAEETTRLLFQSPGAAVLNAPDNITVSPRGGLVLCEDGNGEEFLHGLTVDGEIFKFAKNNINLTTPKNGFFGDFTGSEWAGACYSPDGKWLFANVQSPGVTFAITGPWMSGAL
jgi:secreted PhoX family phosphatase